MNRGAGASAFLSFRGAATVDHPPIIAGTSERGERERTWIDKSPPWLVSTCVHLGILLMVATIGVALPEVIPNLSIVAGPDPQDFLSESDQFSFAELAQDSIGAAIEGANDALSAAAPVLADPTSALDTHVESLLPKLDTGRASADVTQLVTAPKFSTEPVVRGVVGLGAGGALGAIDRITQEILLSLEDKPTLVVWLFDQSGSLARQRAAIIDRFDRIYQELDKVAASGNEAFAKHGSQPLLTSIMEFGEQIHFLTKQPTDQRSEIRAALGRIETDESGFERTFGAVRMAVERYRPFRTGQPRRNVMLVIFTDEAGDDQDELDRDVTLCRRYEIPVYCIGVPAPFGRENSLVRYVDPDPSFDQTPQLIAVRQGPESYMPELVNLGPEADSPPPIDSGFGPFSLTRLCFETGGTYFAVHPNRDARRLAMDADSLLVSPIQKFFNPEEMRNYQPDYLPVRDYRKFLSQNKARSSLVEAAELSWTTPREQFRTRFEMVEEAEFVTQLNRAQQNAAMLEPKIDRLYTILRGGERDRARLTEPRWQAGYDLSMGRVMAAKVRAEGFNAMLAKAKQGMAFTSPTSDTWRLEPANEFGGSSAREKMATDARAYLERVIKDHPRTPWGHLAWQELQRPFGWTWKEESDGVLRRRQMVVNNQNRPPRDDQPRNLPRPEKRPPPKF